MALPTRSVRRLAGTVSGVGSGRSSGARRVLRRPVAPAARARAAAANHAIYLRGLPPPPSGPRRVGVHRPMKAGAKPMPMGDVLRMNKILTGGSAMGIPGGGRAAGASAREAMRIARLPAPPVKKSFWTPGKKRVAKIWGAGMVGSTAIASQIGNSKNSAKGNGQLPGSQTGIYGM